MTLGEIERRKLPLAGVVLSIGAAALSEADELNLDFLRRSLGGRLLAEIPHLSATAEPYALTRDPGEWL